MLLRAAPEAILCGQCVRPSVRSVCDPLCGQYVSPSVRFSVRDSVPDVPRSGIQHQRLPDVPHHPRLATAEQAERGQVSLPCVLRSAHGVFDCQFPVCLTVSFLCFMAMVVDLHWSQLGRSPVFSACCCSVLWPHTLSIWLGEL